MHSVAKDMDIHSYRIPLGVTAGLIRYLFIRVNTIKFYILALDRLIFQQ